MKLANPVVTPNGTDKHSRMTAALPGTGAERPRRHVADQIAGNAFTERGGQPGTDHGEDRADQAPSGRNGPSGAGPLVTV